MRWPRRRAGRSARRVAPRLRVTPRVPLVSPPPVPVRLVPRRRRDALVASVVSVGVLSVLVALFVRTVRHWEAVGVPGQVALALIGAGTVFTMVLYLVALLGFLLPRLIGVRRGANSEAPPSNDSL